MLSINDSDQLRGTRHGSRAKGGGGTMCLLHVIYFLPASDGVLRAQLGLTRTRWRCSEPPLLAWLLVVAT